MVPVTIMAPTLQRLDGFQPSQNHALLSLLHLVLLLPLGASTIDVPMVKFLFSDATVSTTGARCLDGTNSGYYYAPATAKENASKWVLFLEGGGACYDYDDCAKRCTNHLGTSNKWDPTVTDKNNVVSGDPDKNPGFNTWNHVYLPYCSGDLWSGLSTGLDPVYGSFYFAGRINVRTAVEVLIENHAFDQAEAVLIAGASAGAAGTWLNMDMIASYVTNPSAVVKAAPQGGWFFPNVTNYDDYTAGSLAPSANWATVIPLWTGYINEDCAAAQPSGSEGNCCTMDVSYPFLKTPILAVQNQFDSYQIVNSAGCPNDGSPSSNAYIEYFGQQQVLSSQQVQPPNGLWLASCLNHTSDTPISSTTVVNGYRNGQVVIDWFFGINELPHIIFDNCTDPQGLPCNPTCSPPPSTPSTGSRSSFSVDKSKISAHDGVGRFW